MGKTRKRTTLEIGSVSEGTLISSEIAKSLIWDLEHIHLSKENREAVRRLSKALGMLKDNPELGGEEAAADILTSLDRIAQEVCPDYCWFGASPGDGADIGVWPDPELLRHCAEDVHFGERAGAAKSDTHCLEVNDHGNATLFRRVGATNRWVEVWAVV